MAKEKATIVVPAEGEFPPAPIPYAVVSGDGVPDYNHIKSNGKRGGFEYTATVILTKKEDKHFRLQVMEFWENNKPKSAGAKPENWKNITRTDDEGVIKLYAKTKTEFDGKPNRVTIIDGKRNNLDPEVFGRIGEGSEGRLAVGLSIYQGDDYGVSVYLKAVKLTKFKELVIGDASGAFSEDEGDDLSGTYVTGEDEEPKKKKKKKK